MTFKQSTKSKKIQSASDSLAGGTPAIRLFALLEVIAQKDEYFSLQSLVEELGLPKPTVHRMLQQLDQARMIQRDGDGRHYSTGIRLQRFAEQVLINNTVHGARHAVLRNLVSEVGESGNITCCSGDEVLYLDRVETTEPLRFYLRPGSRVPLHCSASGKLFLAQMSKSQRKRLLSKQHLEKYTDRTLVDIEEIEEELEKVAKQGYATDIEEFLPGLTCIAMLIPRAGHLSNIGVAVQAPSLRFKGQRMLDSLPALERAINSLAEIEASNYPK